MLHVSVASALLLVALPGTVVPVPLLAADKPVQTASARTPKSEWTLE